MKNEYPKYEKEFGLILKDLRTKSGLSQEKLAELASFDRTYISLLERGLRQPTLSTLFQLSKCLHVQPSYVIKILEEKINADNKNSIPNL